MENHSQTEAAQQRVFETLGLTVLLAAAFFIYRESFLGFFVQDDFGWLCESRFNSVREYLQCFFRFNNARSYRPLSQETFFLVFQMLFGLWPPAYHAMSMVCHLVASALVFRLLRKFTSLIPSLVGTLFFAVHSGHFRSVFWIAAIPEPMALIFYLASLISFIRFDRQDDRRFLFLSILFMCLGLLSKESILTVPIVLGAYCLLFSRRRLFLTAPHFALTAFYLLLRAVSRAAVDTAPYKLTFGHEAWQNFLTYLSWTACFSEVLLKFELEWPIPGSYLIIAAGFVLATVCLVACSRHRKLSIFSLIWFIVALQPVLYFHDHIFGYYLAPALPPISLLLALALEGRGNPFRWKKWIPATALAGFFLWSSSASVYPEGRWWNDRTYISRDILSAAPELVRQVPPGKKAVIFGFGETEFGPMQNDAALAAFNISPYQYIPVGLHQDTINNIEILARAEDGLRDLHCFVFSKGAFVNWTKEFRRNPRSFILMQPLDELDRLAALGPGEPPVQLEVTADKVTAGVDTLSVRVRNLPANSIDVLYTVDGSLMPAATGWALDGECRTTVVMDASTPKGDYHYRAVRDSNGPDPRRWHPVNIHVHVQ